jgi:hypothetical protein
MTEEIMKNYLLPPIMASLFPVASQSDVVELVAMSSVMKTTIRSIVNVVFVVPIQELEEGTVHVTGATNVYFIRYALNNKGALFSVPPSLYFSNNWVQPISM